MNEEYFQAFVVARNKGMKLISDGKEFITSYVGTYYVMFNLISDPRYMKVVYFGEMEDLIIEDEKNMLTIIYPEVVEP